MKKENTIINNYLVDAKAACGRLGTEQRPVLAHATRCRVRLELKKMRSVVKE